MKTMIQKTLVVVVPVLTFLTSPGVLVTAGSVAVVSGITSCGPPNRVDARQDARVQNRVDERYDRRHGD